VNTVTDVNVLVTDAEADAYVKHMAEHDVRVDRLKQLVCDRLKNDPSFTHLYGSEDLRTAISSVFVNGKFLGLKVCTDYKLTGTCFRLGYEEEL